MFFQIYLETYIWKTFLLCYTFSAEVLRVCQSDNYYFILVALGSISFQATLAKYLICGSTQIYIFDCFLAAPTSQSLFWSLKVEEINLILSVTFAGGAVCAVKS